MSERLFRIILGLSLLVFLAVDIPELVYAYIGMLMFEGITNWRIPILVSKARYGDKYMEAVNACSGVKLNFEAERMLRFLVAVLLVLSYILFNEMLWFFPWFIGVMLLLAGLTNICPMVMALRWVGFK
ncbi:MAG TPA: DUF2892 domain-containing protein [Gammaproteobacteria bacterium]|nr:DUF2892 domain-containing protein [Gammaproteobacteria bacterium]